MIETLGMTSIGVGCSSEKKCFFVCMFRVSECTECKMPASNLAKVFGPTIVGYSSSEAEPMKMLAETTKQAKVKLLLNYITVI